jgi:hypothetical protein
MMAKTNKTKHADIVLANLDLLKTLPNLDFYGFSSNSKAELERLTKTCWACGSVGDSFCVRAHVIARCHGGTDAPDNFFLLCDVCHDEQPDGLPRDVQESWLVNRDSQITNLANWAMGLYNELRKLKTEDEIDKWFKKMGPKKIRKIVHEAYSNAAGWKNGRANTVESIKHSLKTEKV